MENKVAYISKNNKKNEDFSVFWVYSKWKGEIHPVKRQICGHMDNVSIVCTLKKNGRYIW